MSSKLAAIFRPGILPADSGDCPRDRLVCAISTFADGHARTWITEGEYRSLVRLGVRMVVLAER